MFQLKRCAVAILYYTVAYFLANVSIGLLSLLLKMLRITVQGPTTPTAILSIVMYYLVFSLLTFFLFRQRLGKTPRLTGRGLLTCYAFIAVLHCLIVFFAEWNTLWLITKGSIGLTQFMQSGTQAIPSLREIARVDYYKALLLEELCFVFSSALALQVTKSEAH